MNMNETAVESLNWVHGPISMYEMRVGYGVLVWCVVCESWGGVGGEFA